MTFPTTEAAFLADILAHPDDDTPRLIFADWLQENGQELRGEYIRVQCQLAAWQAPGPYTCEFDTLDVTNFLSPKPPETIKGACRFYCESCQQQTKRSALLLRCAQLERMPLRDWARTVAP